MAENRDSTKIQKKKNESGMHGKYYERKTLALIALKCLLQKEIHDFWLLSNPGGIEKFDDIILLVEYNNGVKKLFMVQITHKLKGTERPIIADMLDNTSGKLSLTMYEKAFMDIRKNKHFFENNDITPQVEIFYILYNNCRITQHVANDNICVQSVDPSKYFSFIDSSSNLTNVLKIVNRKQIYDEEFLNNFYFYTEQLNEVSVNAEINDLLKVNNEMTESLVKFFIDWAEPKNNTGKLYKLDIKTKLLEIIFGDFQPPIPTKETVRCRIINTINKFVVTVIGHEDSSKIIWNDIICEIQCFYQDLNIDLSFWEKPLSKDIEDKLISFNCETIQNFFVNRKGVDASITTKLLFLIMVSQSKIPFFIKTDHRLFETFKNHLLPLLNINSVVFNVKKEELHFGDLKTFQNLYDMDEHLYLENVKKITMAFHGKTETDLYTLIGHNPNVSRYISTDIFFLLLIETFKIGKKRDLPEYYINREIKIPLLRKDVLDEKDVLFLIDKFPTHITTKKYKSIDLNEYVLQNCEKFEECNIVTSQSGFTYNAKFLQIIDAVMSHTTYYILKCVPSKYDFFLSLIHTNGSIDILRPYLTNILQKDTELVNSFNNFNVNVICNNAGMGKTMLLNFLSVHFPPQVWIIYIKLGKYVLQLKKIKTVKQLTDFFLECQIKGVNSRFHAFLRALYTNLKYRIIWLIDDYDEVNEPHLLALFEEAKKQGFIVWIVTRPVLKSEFENKFNVFPMELTEFNKNNQIIFLKKFLKQKCKEDIINKIMDATNLLEDSFIGICQQTMMLGKIFLKYEEVGKGQECRIGDLYEKFVTLNIEEYPEKYRKFFLRTVSKLALKVFFTDFALKEVFDLEEFNQDVNIFKSKFPKNDLVTGFGDSDLMSDVPMFSHRTYAEFLTARWLVHTLKKQLKEETPFNIKHILKILYCKELTTVRLFFDNMLVKELPLHSAIVNQEQKNIVDRINESGSYLYRKDLLGRSILHIVCSYGNRYEIGIASEINQIIRNVDEHAQIKKIEDAILLDIPIGPPKYYKLSVIKKVLDTCTTNQAFKKDNFLKLSAADYALMSGSLFELDKLLKCVEVSKFRLSDDTRYFVLYHCIQKNFNNIFEHLDIHDVNHIRVGPSCFSLLHLAVVSENIQAVRKLSMVFDFDHWAIDKEGNTPLHLACNLREYRPDLLVPCSQKEHSILNVFLSRTDINAQHLNLKNYNGQNILYLLARQGHSECIRKIIDKFPGIKIDNPCTKGNSPLIASIMYRKFNVVEALLDNGANVNHRNQYNMTALHYSSSKGFYEFTMKLVRWGADVNCKDNKGVTPLMKACMFGHKKTAKFLLANGANVNLGDKTNWTALHHAIKRKKINIVSLLLENNADINSASKKGKTPLEIACNYDVFEAVKLLLYYSKKVDCLINHMEHALNTAINQKHIRCALLLFNGIG